MKKLISVTNKIVNRLKWEIAFHSGIFTDAKKIQKKVTSRVVIGQSVMLNLGCGSRYHNDWVNIDFRGDGRSINSWDLRQPIPLQNQICDVIYASHVIEHFTRDNAKKLLLECRRLLKVGGCIRLVAPDLEAMTRAYLQELDSVRLNRAASAARHEWMILEMLDQLVRHQSGGEMIKYWSQDVVPEEDFIIERVGLEYLNARNICRSINKKATSNYKARDVGKFRLGGEPHLWMYDDCSLSRLLEECGFKNPTRKSATESAIAGFEEYLLDSDKNRATYKPDSFFMEAFVA